jgi:uncharacterized Zn finger protein
MSPVGLNDLCRRPVATIGDQHPETEVASRQPAVLIEVTPQPHVRIPLLICGYLVVNQVADILPDEIAEQPAAPAGAALARRLGKFPFWRGSHSLIDFFENVYSAAAAKAGETLERG